MVRQSNFITRRFFTILLAILMSSSQVFAQLYQEINWLSFSQLNDSLKANPKNVFVNFYAGWCTYCKEMDRTTFKDKRVVAILKQDYYAVKMDIESRDSIFFGDQIFVNKRSKRINPIHEIALLMASRKNKAFSLPAFVLFNDQFVATGRYFQFLGADTLAGILIKKQ